MASEVPLQFPVGGVDRSCEFSRQPPDTAADAENVRAFDAAGRLRGGSRRGLSKYVDGTVNGASVVQHLNMIVDPTTAALSVTEIPFGVSTTTLPDGSGGGGPGATALVRQGGSGDQPNRDVLPVQAAGGVEWAYVQQTTLGYPDTDLTPELEFVYGDVPLNGSLLVLFVLRKTNGTPGPPFVQNAVGGVYEQAGVEQTFAKLGNNCQLTVWYRVASAGADEKTVSVTENSGGDCVICGVEYSGVVSTSPLGDTSGVSDGVANPMSAGTVNPGSADELILAAFMAVSAPDTVTPGAGFTLRVNRPDGSGDTTDIQLYVLELIGADFPDAFEPTAEFAGGADDHCAAAATFIKG